MADRYRWRKIAPALSALLLVIGLSSVSGCSGDDSPDEEPTSGAATVEPTSEGEPAKVILREDAEDRLGITTAPIVQTTAKPGHAGVLTMPYPAVVYDEEGESWAYSALGSHAYMRMPVGIAAIQGNTAVLSSGPRPGTKVVVVGAAELVGAEAEISGEE